jgi:hypothetical protein
MEDVQGVRLQKLAIVHEPAHLFRGRCQLVDTDHRVHGLRRRKVMAHRADPAEALNDDRDLPEHPASDEPFKPAKLDDMKTGFVDFASLIQADGDFAMAFDTRDRINHYLTGSGIRLSTAHEVSP